MTPEAIVARILLRMDDQPGKADRLRSELNCQQCKYSLRGLHGDVVNCPECGHACNITAMMTRRWTGPWYDAPGFNRLLSPLIWLAILSFCGIWVIAIEQSMGGRGVVAVATYAAIIAVWLLLLWRVRNVPVPNRGFGLAVLAHAVFIGYLGSIAGIIALVITVVVTPSWVRFILAALVVVPIAALWFMRRCEKYIAQQCIRAWLNRSMDQ